MPDIANLLWRDDKVRGLRTDAGDNVEEKQPSRGALPSIVQSFCIEGLYGYRTISLSSEYAATILIAANGSGKTTLLGALDAFLRGQFLRLRDLPFERIRCKLRSLDVELVLERKDVLTYLELKPDGEIYREARRLEVDPLVFMNFISDQFGEIVTDPRLLMENESFSAILRRTDYRRTEAIAFCERLRTSLAENMPPIRFILEALKSALSDVEVVYLPTYRRIELPMVPAPDNKLGRRKRTGFRITQSGLYPGDIQFGLSDISERLSDLNQNILFDSNQGSRQISANIINELIDGTFDRGNPSVEEIPSREELELFFSRLKEGRNVVGPHMEVVSIPNIDKIYRGEDISISGPTNKFLRYFLAKLNAVIGTTRDIEKLVNDFIESCNSYLRSEDESVAVNKNKKQPVKSYLDDKVLRLNRRDLKVHVESVPSSRKITLDALSSGEKQMISLFARLYLYPKQKIVLIDEPELSLSMDWQRRILVDVMEVPLCEQVIAITHSPFVFDNVLEPYARPLKVLIDSESEADLPDETEDDLHG